MWKLFKTVIGLDRRLLSHSGVAEVVKEEEVQLKLSLLLQTYLNMHSRSMKNS
jgi:hypothetical protein